MSDPGIQSLEEINALARKLHSPGELPDIVQMIVDCAATVLGVSRAGIRLLDPTRTRLLAMCRSGEPMHFDPEEEFHVGEGLMGWIVEYCKPLRTGDAQNDPRFAKRKSLAATMASYVGVPVHSGQICLGVLSAVSDEPDHFTELDEQLLGLIANVGGPYIELQRQSYISPVDPLTSVPNRRGLDVALPEQRVSDTDSTFPISVIMVDIDQFSSINGEHGHVVGDQILKEVSRLLAGTLGTGDAVVRYGGEEFLMILPGVHLEAAGRMAEDARRTLQTSSFDFHATHIPLTASFGVAERQSGESRTDLILRADAAVRQAKKRGRNKVLLSD